MESVVLTAPDISCEHCQRAIEGAVGAMSGVERVSVDIPAKRVLAWFDPTITTVSDIVATVEEEGYPASVLVDSAVTAGA
jgi:copper chaperone